MARMNIRKTGINGPPNCYEFVGPIGLLGVPNWDQAVCVRRSLMKAKELRAEIDENNKEVEKDLQADVYKGRV